MISRSQKKHSPTKASFPIPTFAQYSRTCFFVPYVSRQPLNVLILYTSTEVQFADQQPEPLGVQPDGTELPQTSFMVKSLVHFHPVTGSSHQAHFSETSRKSANSLMEGIVFAWLNKTANTMMIAVPAQNLKLGLFDILADIGWNDKSQYLFRNEVENNRGKRDERERIIDPPQASY